MVRQQPVRIRLAPFAALLAALSVFTSAAPPLPEADGRVHTGVASCSSTVCHGRVNADTESPVWLNEYRIWLRQDYHSRAYRTLLTDQSRDIARKLGISAAHTADICLACHADNVAPARRGERFQLEDGVGCEACHGGAGEWLESHAEVGSSHADNIARGMYPTEDTVARAELCLSCHLGTQDKFATHRIMGAGHPRLSFDLETFTVNQPAHYSVDDDYRMRKGDRDPIASWLGGLAANAGQLLALLASDRYPGQGGFPELAFYQCHACHHGMQDLRWHADDWAPDLMPGAVRINDGPLRVLGAALAVIDPDAAQQLRQAVMALHRASTEPMPALRRSAGQLVDTLDGLADTLADRDYPSALQRALRRQLLDAAADGAFSYYTAAEQAFLGVETLSLELGDAENLQALLDALFESLGNETDYLPAQFAAQARRLREGL
jgi:hypothetical protein